ncbi:MAG: hypothetical protein ACYC7D_06550 [Nitrososphaerales archaeon]
MRLDRSIAARQYCRNCRKATDHFGLVTPESQVLFFECVKCGSMQNNFETTNGSWTKNAMLAAAVTGLVGLGAYTLLKHRGRHSQQEE